MGQKDDKLDGMVSDGFETDEPDEGILELLDLSLPECHFDPEKATSIDAALISLQNISMVLGQWPALPQGTHHLIEPFIQSLRSFPPEVQQTLAIDPLPAIVSLLNERVLDSASFKFIMASTATILFDINSPEILAHFREEPRLKNLQTLLTALNAKYQSLSENEGYTELKTFGLQEEHCQKMLLIAGIIIEALDFLVHGKDSTSAYSPSDQVLENVEALSQIGRVGNGIKIDQFGTQYLAWMQTFPSPKAARKQTKSAALSIDDFPRLDDEAMEKSFRQIIGALAIELNASKGQVVPLPANLRAILENVAKFKVTSISELLVAITHQPIVMEYAGFRILTEQEQLNFALERRDPKNLN